MRAEVWKVLSLKYSAVGQASPFFKRNYLNHCIQSGESLFLWTAERREEIKQKKIQQNYFEKGCQHSASSLLQSVPSHLFLWLFASKEISVSEMLLVFFMAMWCSPFRGCWDALFILWPWNLCAVSRCWGIDRAQWWTGGVSPAANQKLIVCPSRRGNDPLGRHIARANSNSNATAFDFVCVHTERQRFVPACSSCQL